MVLFALGIFFPKLYMEFKYLLLLLCLAIGFFYLIKSPKVNKAVFIWFVAYFTYFLFWIVIGIYNGNSVNGLKAYIKLNCMYTLVFFIMMSGLNKRGTFELIFKSILSLNLLIAAYIIVLYINALGIQGLQFVNYYTYNVSSIINEGYTKVASPIVFSMIFTIPFTLVYYSQKGINRNTLSLVNILLSYIAIVISGNRILLLITIGVSCMCILKNKKRTNIFFCILILFVVCLGLLLVQLKNMDNFDGGIILKRIISELKFSEDNLRWKQIIELYKGFLNNPILGTGFAKGVTAIVRNENEWLYEVVYMLYLYNSGIVGITIYLSIILSVIMMGWRLKYKFKEDVYIVPTMIGYCSLLIACWTNPILNKFDAMWFMFIIPMYYNSRLTKRKV